MDIVENMDNIEMSPPLVSDKTDNTDEKFYMANNIYYDIWGAPAGPLEITKNVAHVRRKLHPGAPRSPEVAENVAHVGKR